MVMRHGGREHTCLCLAVLCLLVTSCLGTTPTSSWYTSSTTTGSSYWYYTTSSTTSGSGSTWGYYYSTTTTYSSYSYYTSTTSGTGYKTTWASTSGATTYRGGFSSTTGGWSPTPSQATTGSSLYSTTGADGVCEPAPTGTKNSKVVATLSVGDEVSGNTRTSTSFTATYPGVCGSSGAKSGDLYQFSGPGGYVTFSVCAKSDFDSYLKVYYEENGCMRCLGFNDDYCGLKAQISVPTVQGRTYYVLVGGAFGYSGRYTLTVNMGRSNGFTSGVSTTWGNSWEQAKSGNGTASAASSLHNTCSSGWVGGAVGAVAVVAALP